MSEDTHAHGPDTSASSHHKEEPKDKKKKKPKKGSSINARAFGFAIFVMAAFYFFNPWHMLQGGDNLGQRFVNLTDPNNPWQMPNISENTMFMVLVIVVAVVMIFFPSKPTIIVKPEAKKDDGHGHGH